MSQRCLIPCPEPGVYQDAEENEYRCWDAASQSFLTTLIHKSPMHAWDEWEHPSAPSPAMQFGSAAHMALFQPNLFDSAYAVMPEGLDRRRKADKEIWNEAIQSGKTPITDADHMKIMAIESSLENHRLGRFIRGGLSEVAIVWDDAQTGVRCKGRLDKYFDGLILDQKFTADVSAMATTRHICRFGYDIQAAFYSDGAEQAFGQATDDYLLMTIESERPFGVRVWDMSKWIDRGRSLYRKALGIYAKCKAEHRWPGYPQAIEPIDLPAWARQQ